MSDYDEDSLSIDDLLSNLLSNPVFQPSIQAEDINKGRWQTSIRINESTRRYFEAQSKRLKVTPQALLSMTLDAVVARTLNPEGHSLKLVKNRFFLLFKSHGIPIIHIKHIIDTDKENNFPLGAIANPALLLDAITPSTIDTLSCFFHVDASWLEGDSYFSRRPKAISSRDDAFNIKNAITGKKMWDQHVTLDSSSIQLICSMSDEEISNLEAPPKEVLIVIQYNLILKDRKKISTFNVAGSFQTDNLEAKIALFSLSSYIDENGYMWESYQISEPTFQAIKSGMLFSEIDTSHRMPWDKDRVLNGGLFDEDIYILSQLLAGS